MAVIQQVEQRVGIFIDTQNIYHSARNLYGAKVDFGAVMKKALGKRRLVRAIAYVITTDAGDETMFLEALEKIGVETMSKELQVFPGGFKKADWDVGIVVDAITLAPKLDVIIIVSGDGDFVPAIDYLKMQGCQVEVVAFSQSASSRIQQAADHFTDLSIDADKYLLGR